MQTLVMTPTQLLTAAEHLLDRPDAKTVGAWPRAAALLARQALEQALDAYWKLQGTRRSTSCPPAPSSSACRSTWLTSPSASRVSHAWGALSDACHHHPYEFAPSAGELRGWIKTVSAFAQQAQAPAAPEPR